MECLSSPLPGLHNCLAGYTSSSSTVVSALTSKGQVLISPHTKAISFSAPATAHACADPFFFARALNRTVFLYSHPGLQPIQLQPLHFQVRHLNLYVHHNNNLILVIACGCDGAYFAYIPFAYNSSNIPIMTHSNYAFQPIHGSQSYTVVHVAVAHDAVALVLMDSRVAIWADISAPAVVILDPQITSAQGDRVTDLKFIHAFLLIACWSGTTVCYSRAGPTVSKLFVIESQPASRNNSFLKHGPTMIIQGPDQVYSGTPVALFVTAYGRLTFVNLSDGFFVTTKIKSQGRCVLIKGVCCLHHDILFWIFGVPNFTTVQWPALHMFNTNRLEKQNHCRNDRPLTQSIEGDQQQNNKSLS